MGNMACKTHSCRDRRMDIFSSEFRLVMAFETKVRDRCLKEFLTVGFMGEMTCQAHAVFDRRMCGFVLEFYLVVACKTQ